MIDKYTYVMKKVPCEKPYNQYEIDLCKIMFFNLKIFIKTQKHSNSYSIQI